MLVDFQNSFIFRFSNKFAIEAFSWFLPTLTMYYTTLQNLNANFIILPQLLQKLTSKFINVIHILTRISITCFWLNSNCLSYARSVVSSLSSSKTMCQLNECAQPQCHCLPFQTSEMGNTQVYFIMSMLHHLDLNPMNPKMCIKIQKRVFLRKIHNVNWPTLWYGCHGFE